MRQRWQPLPQKPPDMTATSPVFDRFWAKVDRDGPTPAHCPDLGPCWVWTARCRETGYGELAIGGVSRRSHRVSWVLTNGPIPDGLQVLHRCDNPPCVRVSHLFLGTNADNVRDREAKHRRTAVVRGEANPRARLTEARVREMRRLSEAGWTGTDLATMFGVGDVTARDAVAGRTWTHV